MTQNLYKDSIFKRGKVCVSDQKPFAQGEELLSCLSWNDEKEALLREDFCTTCWLKVHKKNAPSLHSYWQNIFQKTPLGNTPDPRDPLKHKRIDYEKLRDIFAGETDTELKFLLALALERKKLIFRTKKKRKIFNSENNDELIFEDKTQSYAFLVNEFGINPKRLKEHAPNLRKLLEELRISKR